VSPVGTFVIDIAHTVRGPEIQGVTRHGFPTGIPRLPPEERFALLCGARYAIAVIADHLPISLNRR
jgi:hypothetical protein